MSKYNCKEINYPLKKDDCKKIEKNNLAIVLHVLCAKNEKYNLSLFKNKTQSVNNKLLL